MPYRIFVIGDAGRFIKSIELDDADEATAISKARILAEDRAFELWQRDRKIARFDAKPS
jgi:hypothetical protein